MEDKKEEQKEKTSTEATPNNEIFDFGYLINVILDYYCDNTATSLEEGENWKRDTDYDNRTVPDDVDALVKKAFKAQLNKFIK